jgi:hypothetical protein
MRTTAVLLVAFWLASCHTMSSHIQYCDGSQSQSGRATQFDLVSGRAIVGGRIDIHPLTQGAFLGFGLPFPLLVFDPTVELASLRSQMDVGDYQFTLQSAGRDGRDWWLIYGEPKGEAVSRTRMRSTVLYSPSRGVLAITYGSNLMPDGLFSTLIPCEGRTLTYRDLERLVEASEKRLPR